MASNHSTPSVVQENQDVVEPPNHKGLLQSKELYEYLLATSVYPRETKELKEMRELSESDCRGIMTLSADEAQFLMMLLKLMNAKNTMEIGVFVGYSLLSTALTLPEDGKIIAIDIEKEDYEKGRPIIEKAGVSHKIDFREGPAMAILDDILNRKGVEEGSIDFVLVDADKKNCMEYHERLLRLVRVGGVIAYDNTLWFGTVPDSAEKFHPLMKNEQMRDIREQARKVNSALALDSRIEISHLSIGDGLILCRRLH